MSSWIFIVAFLFFLVMRIPIAFSLGLSCVIYCFLNGQPLALIPQIMTTTFDSFPMLAIPLFMLAGQLMNTGGVTKRLFDFAKALVGHIPGGLGHVNVVVSLIFSGMSGSAVADSAGLGAIEIKYMIDEGYDPDFSAAVTSCSSTVGPIIPPSIPFVIYGSMAGVSIAALFLAGAIPGLLMGLAMMVVVYLISLKRSYKVYKRASIRELWIAFRGAFLPLLTPVIILGGIWTGIATPTEAAVVAVAYAIFLGVVVYKELSIRDLFRIFVDVGQSTGTVIFIASIAAVFGWIIAYEAIPSKIASVLLAISHNKNVILLIINFLLLALGCFMETISVLLIIIPMLMPTVTLLGIDPVHFGVVVTLNLMIGLITPPVGICSYVVSDLAKISFERVIKASLPFMGILILVLLLVTYVPATVLWLPGLVIR